MTWSPFALLRRRLFPARRTATTVRNKPARRRQPIFELLEDRTVPSTYSISSSFNATAVAPGGTLWLSSDINSAAGVGSAPVTITVTNQTLTFTDSYGGAFNLSLPNATLTLNPSGGSATTTFNTTTNQWVSSDPTGLAGNLFLSGIEVPLPSGLHGSDNPVTWSANFSCDTSGVSFKWGWAAAAYNSFSTTYSALGVKPCDSSTASSYKNTDKAGTPESYKTHVVGGGTGTGGTNYIGNLTPTTAISPTYTPTFVSIAGTVYNDANNNGVFDTGDVGLSGVTLTLTGVTSGGVTVTPATATTASDGTYSFTTDGSGNKLPAGTYQVAETAPAGYYQGTNNVGTDNGTTDGTVVPGNAIGTIVLGAGDSGVNYNFGQVNPFAQVTPAYPYSSTNSLTNVAFNESSVLAGASVNVADGKLDLFYTDEHAMTLGVSSVSVKTSTGTTVTNYPISGLLTNPGSAVNPYVGDTATTGTYAAVDASGRPLFPSLYITDITASPSSTSGDWQNGGTAVAPNAVYGTWKSASITVDQTTTPATITQTPAADPTANGWTMPAGADPVPSSLTNAGYGTEVQWSLSSLYNSGSLIPGHNYRFYFIVHDGDQNQVGGDCGQAAYNFTYRGPVTLSGNVYNDVYGNGVDTAGDPGIGGVSLTLSGTTVAGASVTATTTTAANGSYSFTVDTSGNTLTAGTYQITETPPANYLPGYNTVGAVSWGPSIQTAWSNTNTTTTSPGYVQDNAGAAQLFSGSGSLDTNGIGKWAWASGTPAASNDILDAFGDTFNDSLTGHTFLLGGMDRYSNSAATTVGFWAFQNAVSVNADGTFSGVHTNGDLFFLVTFSSTGASTTQVYEWTGNDTSGSLTLVSPPTGSTFLNVNTSPASVPWSFTDSAGKTSPQAGELVELGVDLNAIYGSSVPHFVGFMAETQLASGTSGTPSDFAVGSLNTVSGTFQSDGSLVPPNAIGSIVTTYGQNGMNYNFGEVQPVTVSGVVYQDTNGTGLYSASDAGIGGVTLTLTGTNNLGASVTATTTTAANGTYSFSTDSTGKLLAPGTYQIVETPPSGYIAGGTNVGTDNGATDGTVVASGTIGSIIEHTGDNAVNYDFGEVKPVTVSGLVYQDSNGNNVLDAGEPGIAGVTVTLTGTNGLGQAITATATTAANGSYSFTTDSGGNALRPGTYTITETAPSGYLLGAVTVGTVGGIADGSAASATQIGSIALTSGQAGVNYNFGDLKPVALSGTVYQDSNGNNALDAGEPGIAGVTVTLTGTNGLGQAITATTTTSASGTYSFTTDTSGNALRPGTYVITETAPSGYLLGAATVGMVNGTADGNALSATQISAIALTSGQSGINYNFGDLKPVALSGTVYRDANDNGVVDAGESGIGGVTVTLAGTNGLGQSITATTTTAANGTYSFITDSSGNALRPGSYTITETAPSGYIAGTTNVGTVNSATDGTSASFGTVSAIALTSGQAGVNYNFGHVKAVSLSGLVYQDTNGNGVLDSNEPSIAGVTMTLTGTNDQGQSVSATVTTGTGGTFSFTTDSSGNPLRPGTYTITETLPTGYLQGTTAVGTVSGSADGSVVTAGQVGSIVLTDGQSGINYLFGNLKAISVSGTVYLDTNGNGVFDAGEPGIGGVTVTLSGINGLGQSKNATVTTAVDGTYTLTLDSSGKPLRPGTYTITETAPSGYLLGAAAVGTVNGSADGTVVSATQIGTITLSSGQAGVNYNFGDLKAVALSGQVYQDTNGNNALDAGEPGISGVTVTLTGTNGLGQAITATTTTAANGMYSFTTDSGGNALRPGTYVITETAPSGYLLGAAAAGTVGGVTDGTVSSATRIAGIALTSGQAGSNYLFGDLLPGSVSGLVYQDSNGNGVLDTGEPGIAGVTVTLAGTNGLGQAITATTTTAVDGTYSFTKDSGGNVLRPGTYQIVEMVPSGYMADSAAVGTVGGTADGTVASVTTITSIALTSGQAGINYQFSDVKPIAIAGVVYQDTNGNNALDAGEPGIGGVTLTLDAVGLAGEFAVATATTRADGTYFFTQNSSGIGLWPGTYKVIETAPSGYLAGATTVGTDNGTPDGTVVSSGIIGSIVLTSGQAGINYDFGHVKPITLSGTVFLDSNDSGALNTGEPGISGVTLTLTGTNNLGQSITATTATAADGTYSFTTDSSGNQLRPGTYQIAETAIGNYLQGTNAVGTVNGTADGSLVPVDQIGSIALTSGQSGINYNFGWLLPVTVSGTAYLDANEDGVYGSGDSPFANVTLTLTGTNGQGQAVTATTTTAADGTYSFTTDSNGNSLVAGTYEITETVPTGYVSVNANVGTVGGALDGTRANTCQLSNIVVASGENGVNYNFGLSLPASVSGYVYLDDNGTQTYTAGDRVEAGATLQLTGTDANGNSVSLITTTNANGYYSFTGLMAGTYSITLLDGTPTFLAEVANVGTVNNTLVGVASSLTEIDQVVLVAGNLGANYDFGGIYNAGLGS